MYRVYTLYLQHYLLPVPRLLPAAAFVYWCSPHTAAASSSSSSDTSAATAAECTSIVIVLFVLLLVVSVSRGHGQHPRPQEEEGLSEQPELCQVPLVPENKQGEKDGSVFVFADPVEIFMILLSQAEEGLL